MTVPDDTLENCEARSVRAHSVTSKSSRKKKSNKKKKAKEWTYYVETLKKTCDCLYELCRSEQSIVGCKEASLYLRNADKDFQSLIEAINLEQSFSRDDPQAVAWEIRKTMGSPGGVLQDKPSLLGVLPLSPMVISASQQLQATFGETQDTPVKQGVENDGWQVVRRRRSSSMTTDSQPTEESLSVKDLNTSPPRTLTVYERLALGRACRRHVSGRTTRDVQEVRPAAVPSKTLNTARSSATKLTCPKSAMDLPQTKASMAKISYCRQRMWETSVQPTLAEKLKAKQKRERVTRSASNICGLNFKDPETVRKCAREFNATQLQKKQSPPQGPADGRSLPSICETMEADENDIIPSDPKPTLNCKSEPPPEISVHLNLEDDDEWREMTEEEQSLAMEEQSLNLEIERAESEFEAELAKQVDVEAAAAQFRVTDKPTSDNKASEQMKSMDEIQKFFDRMKEELKSACTTSWAEIVEKECNGRYHQPGEVLERHEKMSSPSRRKCDKDDYDFGRKHIEKQRKADECRERLHEARAQRLRELSLKREEIREKQRALLEKKRLHIEKKMERAQENREKSLAEIVLRAKSDEQRVAEVQFLHLLQQQQDTYRQSAKAAGAEERIQSLAEERLRRSEEKTAKEQAVEERRKQIEQNRIKHVQERNETPDVRMATFVQGIEHDDRDNEPQLNELDHAEVAEVNTTAVLENLPTDNVEKQSMEITEEISRILKVESTVPDGDIHSDHEQDANYNARTKTKKGKGKKKRKLRKTQSNSFDSSFIKELSIPSGRPPIDIIIDQLFKGQNEKSVHCLCDYDPIKDAPAITTAIRCMLEHSENGTMNLNGRSISPIESRILSVAEYVELKNKLDTSSSKQVSDLSKYRLPQSVGPSDKTAVALSLAIKSVIQKTTNSSLVQLERAIDDVFSNMSTERQHRFALGNSLVPVASQLLHILRTWSDSKLKQGTLEKLAIITEKSAQCLEFAVNIVFCSDFAPACADLFRLAMTGFERRFLKLFGIIALSLDQVFSPITLLPSSFVAERFDTLRKILRVEIAHLVRQQAECLPYSLEALPAFVSSVRSCGPYAKRLFSLVVELLMSNHLIIRCACPSPIPGICPNNLQLIYAMTECNDVLQKISTQCETSLPIFLTLVRSMDEIRAIINFPNSGQTNLVKMILTTTAQFVSSSRILQNLSSCGSEQSLLVRTVELMMPCFIRKDLKNLMRSALIALTSDNDFARKLFSKEANLFYLT